MEDMREILDPKLDKRQESGRDFQLCHRYKVSKHHDFAFVDGFRADYPKSWHLDISTLPVTDVIWTKCWYIRLTLTLEVSHHSFRIL